MWRKPRGLTVKDIMGKGQVISGGTAGQYQVKLLLDGERVNKESCRLEGKAASSPDGIEKTAMIKRQEQLAKDMPKDETRGVWCADLTENLTGEVGTIEKATSEK